MIIFDEEKYAIDIINSGFKNKSIFKDVAIVAKYLRYKNDNEDYVRKNIYALCKEYKKDFNLVKDYKIMDSIISESKKWKIKLGKNINITKKEFDIINSEDEKVKKVLFVLLVISKFYYNDKSDDYYVNIPDNDIFKLCNLNIKKSKKIEIMHYITQKEYVTPNIHMSMKINYIYKDSQMVYNIPVGNDMIIYFEQLLGKKTISCEKCGTLVLKTNNRVKYCKSCSKLIHIEQIKDSVNKQRSQK